MSTKPISFRVEEDLKEKAEALLGDMDLTMSSAVSLFLKQMVNKQAIPFAIEASGSFYSQANQAEIQRRLDNYDNVLGNFSFLLWIMMISQFFRLCFHTN